jgi:hypothetical protein
MMGPTKAAGVTQIPVDLHRIAESHRSSAHNVPMAVSMASETPA